MGLLKHVNLAIFYILIILIIQWFFSLCHMEDLGEVVKNETLYFLIIFSAMMIFSIYIFFKKINYVEIFFTTYMIFILSQLILFLLKVDCIGEYPNDFNSFISYSVITLLRGGIILFPVLGLIVFSKIVNKISS